MKIGGLSAIDTPDLHVCQHDIPYGLGGAIAFIRFYLGCSAAVVVATEAAFGSSIVT